MEKAYYYYTGEWYKGSMPTFYDSENQQAAKVLRNNFEVIRDEVLRYFNKNVDDLEPNFTPYNYIDSGWKTVNLISYFIKYHNTLKEFPETMKALSQVEGLCGVQISVLAPQTRIKAHIGDTNAIMRNHIGIRIPGGHPDIGFRVKNKEVCWKEGDTISFCVVHRHYAWNYTDVYRIIFQVDTILPEYRKRKFWVVSRTLSAITTKLLATKKRSLRKTPRFLVHLTHFFLAFGYWTLIVIQHYFNYPIEKIFAATRKKKVKNI